MNGRRGNAILFSMIIMTAAMTISLGMVSLVVGESRSAALVLPAERGYYKAESYVEQALWQKKQDPNYQVAKKEDLPSNFLCAAAGCAPFTTAPTGVNNDDLKEFFASTSPPQKNISLPVDTPQQFDVVTTGASGSGTLALENIKGGAGYKGLEVTIVAYPKSTNPTLQFPIDDPNTTAVEQKTTPVFVDKVVVPPSGLGGCDSRPATNSCNILLNPTQQNLLGEAYPSLDSSNVYRLRIKALGADASADLTVTTATGSALTLRSPDFTVRAVADDANSRRGIQVLAAAAQQITSIFDFVIFSDYDLDKLRAKAAGTKLITTTAYQDQNGNCLRDAGDTPLSGVAMTAHPNSGPDSTVTTDATGVAAFPNLQSGMTYTVSAGLTTGSTVCTPPGNSQTATFAADNTNEAKPLTFLIKAPPRVPLYRFWSDWAGDHFYTTQSCTVGSGSSECGPNGTWKSDVAYFNGNWRYEGITGYLYTTQVPGTQPLYRAWNGTDHYYTMSLSDYQYWTTHGYTAEGVAGYLDPYNGTDAADGRTGCPTGSDPLYHSWSNKFSDNFYTMNEEEWNGAVWNQQSQAWWAKVDIAGCMWTTP